MGDDVVRDEASVWAIGFFFAGDLVRADLSDVVFYPFFTVNSMKRMLSTQAASIILAGCEQYVLQRWHDVTGNILLLLREAMAFVKANTRKGWEKLPDGRKNKPEYAERAVLEALVNHFIHRDYTVMGSEVHLDIFDDRLAITSPGGMYSGQIVQESSSKFPFGCEKTMYIVTR